LEPTFTIKLYIYIFLVAFKNCWSSSSEVFLTNIFRIIKLSFSQYVYLASAPAHCFFCANCKLYVTFCTFCFLGCCYCYYCLARACVCTCICICICIYVACRTAPAALLPPQPRPLCPSPLKRSAIVIQH